MCECQNKIVMEDNNGFDWSDLGDLADKAIDTIGTNFQSGAQDNQSRAQYNAAVAKLVSAKADAEKTKTKEYTKAANTLVMFLGAALILYVFAKFILPKIK